MERETDTEWETDTESILDTERRSEREMDAEQELATMDHSMALEVAVLVEVLLELWPASVAGHTVLVAELLAKIPVGEGLGTDMEDLEVLAVEIPG
jgi:hypothetical protein